MKIKLLFILLIVFSACSKKVEKSSLESPEFKDLVGIWTTDYPNDELRKVIVYKNGKVELSKSVERGNKFRVTELRYNNSFIIYNSDTLPQIGLISYANGKSRGSIYFYKKLYSDSAFIGFGPYIKNYEIDTTFGITKKKYFKN